MNLSVQYLTIFLIFLKLGFTSFGGPAAHLVFFHRTFVEKYRWLTSDEYTQLVALAQLLPGPTSSQVGLGIGYLQRGYGGRSSGLAWFHLTLYNFNAGLCATECFPVFLAFFISFSYSTTYRTGRRNFCFLANVKKLL